MWIEKWENTPLLNAARALFQRLQALNSESEARSTARHHNTARNRDASLGQRRKGRCLVKLLSKTVICRLVLLVLSGLPILELSERSNRQTFEYAFQIKSLFGAACALDAAGIRSVPPLGQNGRSSRA